MANIRIDNASDDVLKIELDGEEYFIPEDGSITISPVEKGNHRLIACRAIRTETDKKFDSDKDNPTRKLSKDENSQYVQLKGVFEINVIASKSVWTVKKKPILVEKTVDGRFFPDRHRNFDFYRVGSGCALGKHFRQSGHARRQRIYISVDIRSGGN